MFGYGRFSIPMMVGMWRYFMATSRGTRKRRRVDGNFVEQSTLNKAGPRYIQCFVTSGNRLMGSLHYCFWDDVITLFHEFGHTLHGLFAVQRYATLLRYANTPRDFVSRLIMSIGQAIHACSNATRVIIDSGEKMPALDLQEKCAKGEFI